MISFEHVGLRYGIGPEVLEDVSFTLARGSFHFLTGRSGAGKTSLLKLLYLGMKPTRGLISMFDSNIGSLSREEMTEMRQKIGVVFQDFRLLPSMNAFDNVALPLRLLGYSEADVKRNVEELLDWVGLADHKRSLPSTLSGGQQQRVAIARAVISKPRLLLADEPTGNLDDRIGTRLMLLFEQLNKMGTTIVVATHSPHIIERFQHPLLVLKEGRMSQETAAAYLQRGEVE